MDEEEALASFLDKPIAVGVILLLLVHFGARLVYVPSRSMLDTLHVHDVLVVDCLHYRLASPTRGEIAVFYEPSASWWRAPLLVKRIVALDGDKVGIHKGQLYINDEPQLEPYVAESLAPALGGRQPIQADFSDRQVAPRCFFALGDNRGNSLDSRSYGDVPLGNLVGLVRARVWPSSRIAIF